MQIRSGKKDPQLGSKISKNIIRYVEEFIYKPLFTKTLAKNRYPPKNGAGECGPGNAENLNRKGPGQMLNMGYTPSRKITTHRESDALGGVMENTRPNQKLWPHKVRRAPHI